MLFRSGYTEQCYVGQVYNNSSSDFDFFFQRDRNVQVKDELYTASVSNAYPTINDISAWVPPRPVGLLFSCYSSGGASDIVILGENGENYNAETQTTLNSRLIAGPIQLGQFQNLYFYNNGSGTAVVIGSLGYQW